MMDKTIMKLAKSIQIVSKKAVIIYKRELEGIINSNCRDKYWIEHALDGILGFCFDPNMIELYRKFCRFYYGIDQDAAIRHVHYYRDMWDPEEKKEWLRVKTNRARK